MQRVKVYLRMKTKIIYQTNAYRTVPHTFEGVKIVNDYVAAVVGFLISS